MGKKRAAGETRASYGKLDEVQIYHSCRRTRSKVQVRDSKLGENSPIMNLSLHTWQEAFKSVDWLL
jgi:hypothetical protein